MKRRLQFPFALMPHSAGTRAIGYAFNPMAYPHLPDTLDRIAEDEFLRIWEERATEAGAILRKAK